MNANTNILPPVASTYPAKTRLLDEWAKKGLFSLLRKIHDGQITIVDGGETFTFGKMTNCCSLSAKIHVLNPGFYSDIAFGGSIGAGEAYMAGYWYSDNLTDLIQIMARNIDVLDNMESGTASFTRPLQKFLHWLNRNTQSGSRRNIAAHYDLGNEFFRLMLDETMMYSCAVFAKPEMSLYQAQVHRLDMICEKLNLTDSDHLLEIGTGWGGLAIHAAKHYGCKVTTTTISQKQYELARQRIRENGLEHKVTVLLEDYRDLEGKYDKVVSVEMIEAVGLENHATYFNQCSRLLKSGGMMLLQAITIADQRYDYARRNVDFIQKYIFPGGSLPSVTSMMNDITQHTDMRLFHLEDIGPHYATTLRKWHQNVKANLPQIRENGYSDTFLRMWDFYLCYCEGGFMQRTIGTVQMLLGKPDIKMETYSKI
jgi:cyclopropane-fatty-acyl-phospholipid synthase